MNVETATNKLANWMASHAEVYGPRNILSSLLKSSQVTQHLKGHDQCIDNYSISTYISLMDADVLVVGGSINILSTWSLNLRFFPCCTTCKHITARLWNDWENSKAKKSTKLDDTISKLDQQGFQL